MDNFFNPEATKSLENMPKKPPAEDLATFFKVFGDTTRIKILFLLLNNELCVNDLSLLLNMKQPAISHQLSILKRSKIVKLRKEGKLSFYSLDDDHVSNILTQGIEHLTH